MVQAANGVSNSMQKSSTMASAGMGMNQRGEQQYRE
jgi:hypothetical protein